MTPLPASDAEAIWAVLVAHAGASDGPYDGEAFVQLQSTQVVDEYRFGGSLGFGGKFRRHLQWTCDGYTEDETPARLAMTEATNQALAELQKARAA